MLTLSKEARLWLDYFNHGREAIDALDSAVAEVLDLRTRLCRSHDALSAANVSAEASRKELSESQQHLANVNELLELA
jgi:hypothetical protein